LLEVFDQGRGRLVRVVALFRDMVRQIAVLVPPHVIELHESHVALDQPPGQKAISCIAARPLDIQAVHVKNVLGFLRNVRQFGHRGLHAEGKLVLFDAGECFRVSARGVLIQVESLDVVEHLPPSRAAAADGIRQIQHRFLPAPHLYALIARRETSASPQAIVERLIRSSSGNHDDERRQIFVQRSKAVGDPGAHARPAR